MPSAVADPQVAAALDAAGAAVGRIAAAEPDPVGVTDAYAQIRELEVVERQVRAQQVRLLNVIGRSGLHQVDGHASPKVMMRYAANLSPAEAAQRAAMATVTATMPIVAAAFADGAIGDSQVKRIARTLSNPRVRDAFVAQDANVAVLAHRLPYVELDQKLTDWERLEDQDGARQKAERDEASRKHRVHTDYDGNHHIDAFHPGLPGIEIKAIHERFCQIEWEKDWAEARERLGDAATVSDLRRTAAQRSADAAVAAWRAANAAQADAGGSLAVVDIVVDHDTLDDEIDHAFGNDPGPDPRADTLLSDAIEDLDEPAREDEDDAVDEGGAGSASGLGDMPRHGRMAYRCHTGDGTPIHPREALAAALQGHVRRVIFGANGVVLDMGQLRRLFKGPQRDAVMLSGHRCTWIGCLVPTSQCQADHMDGFNGPRQGCTCPENGEPLCGRHNLIKERGFTVYRDERGRIHILRPDGTEIT